MRLRQGIRARWATVLLLVVVVVVGIPGSVLAAEPPNRNDPCSVGGKNTCDTNGVGFYDTYRYGVRWFGDFKNAVPGQPRGFCIDLRFWYPSAAYKYTEDKSGSLVNRDKEAVTLESQRRMAYALWAFGRSTTPSQQAAVMLYVHSQMGDARAGEASPDELDAGVRTAFARITKDSAAYHGPYRIVVTMPSALKLGAKGTATIRVLSATGKALPGVLLTLRGTGATGVPSTTKTAGNGIATVGYTAASASDVSLDVRTEPLPSTLPKIFRPTTAAAAPNGQRLAVPSSQVVAGSGSTSVAKSKLEVTSVAVPAEVAIGEGSTDRITIKGASPTFKVTAKAKLHGPFRSPTDIRCDQTPAWQGTWKTNGSGETITKPVKLDTPGWYVYQHTIPSDANHVGLTTPCTDAKERVKVVAVPAVTTVVSEKIVAPGTEIYDTVTVSGLAGEPAVIEAVLYGPFANRKAIVCTTTPAWSGTISITADGEFKTEAVKLTVPGFYTYRETLTGGDFVKSAQTLCGEAAETTIVTGEPKVKTQVSAKQTRPGATITDKVIVTGLGELAGTVKVELFGPFATVGGITCDGEPVWSSRLAVTGDGTYTTSPVRISRVGYYTFRESLAKTPQYSAFDGKCGETSETTVARAAPRVTTLVSNEVVVPGSTITDRVRVTGLGRTEARIDMELFGPFGTRASIRCSGTALWKGSFTAKGDGVYTTTPVRLARAGFYTYRERLVGSTLITGTQGACGAVSETALARPFILTGKGEHTASQQRAAESPLTPARVQLDARGIDATVFSAGIDLAVGALDVPKNIRRVGWWADGVLPGGAKGAVLIAGHVDSANAGAGAFFRLKEAQTGDRVLVTTNSGRVFAYKVVSVETMAKAKLPPDIFARQGRPRLVLVTCGGPFIESEGHYRDNIVVTAVPV